ncbi:hypothetical protein FRC17_009549 [Serendipita sp. 399]|nr:hypothetical protein FRC17_009549 [Serendipita sp. 399]
MNENQSRVPAISRIPTEILLLIFDSVFEESPSFLVDTTFEGDSWALYIRQAGIDRPATARKLILKDFRSRRKLLGSVNSLWRRLVYSSKFYILNLAYGNSDGLLEDISTARAVNIDPDFVLSWLALLPSISRGVQWEVATLDQIYLSDLATIPHPQLRRVDVEGALAERSTGKWFESFRDLTWLELGFDLNEPEQSIELPYLQVLVLRVDTFDSAPIKAPNLRHIYIRTATRNSAHLCTHYLTFYGSTLQSISIKAPFMIPTPPVLCLGTNFPALKELALCGPATLDIDTLPNAHPLHRLLVTHWDSVSMDSWLDLENLQGLYLCHGRWSRSGGLRHKYSDHYIPGAHVDLLLRKAERKGIRIELTGYDWSDPILPRPTHRTKNATITSSLKVKVNITTAIYTTRSSMIIY